MASLGWGFKSSPELFRSDSLSGREGPPSRQPCLREVSFAEDQDPVEGRTWVYSATIKV